MRSLSTVAQVLTIGGFFAFGTHAFAVEPNCDSDEMLCNFNCYVPSEPLGYYVPARFCYALGYTGDQIKMLAQATCTERINFFSTLVEGSVKCVAAVSTGGL